MISDQLPWQKLAKSFKLNQLPPCQGKIRTGKYVKHLVQLQTYPMTEFEMFKQSNLNGKKVNMGKMNNL